MQILEIAQNSVERLTHGWFVVKNRSTQDIHNGVTLKQRNTNEQNFFSKAPWTALSKDRIGIQMLRQFLGKLLYDHIKGEFPALVQDIRNLVADSRATMEALGAPRQSTLQQRQFLSRIADKYQHKVTASLRGDYGADWEANDCRKLRMQLQLSNETFAAEMTKHGHTRAFQNINGTVDELDKERTSEESIYSWIRRGYRESRGAELPGTVNPVVLETLFRQQAKKWKMIADKHLKSVYDHVTTFDSAAWDDLAVEGDVRERMESRSAPEKKQAFTRAQQQLRSLVEDEMTGILQTVNHYYADNLAKARSDRVLHRLKGLGIPEAPQANNWYPSAKEIAAAVHLSNEDQAVHDIHDILKAYYKVALKRFTDNVVIQCVERCFAGAEGPLRYISPGLIGELTDDDLEYIAAENYATSSKRTETMHRLERLEKALTIAETEKL